MQGTLEERRDAGRAQRALVPRSSLADWAAPADRDPIAVLEQQAESRVPELLPVRYGRMAESPFAFFRGGAAIMVMDLSATPTTGICVQATGDAHVSNFGMFASPERNLVFDINDFDETTPGPWEWDVKRLCASLQIVCRQRGFSPGKCEQVVITAARAYREHLADYATWRVLDLWYERTEIKNVIDRFPKKYHTRVNRDAAKALRKDHLRAVEKLTEVVDGQRRFVEDPPLLVRLDNIDIDYDIEDVANVVEHYRATLTDERRHMFDRFRLLDVAFKAVGVGSVGTKCWIALLEGPDHPEGDLIVLQIKEAQPSVLEPYVGASELGHHGKRVVVGQRLIQAAGDVFLGWATAEHSGNQYYFRQLWDAKGQGDPMLMPLGDLTRYGELCAWILARSHARTGDAVEITGYLGRSSRFERAIAAFAASYAQTNEQDHVAMLDAIASGRLKAATQAS